MNAFMRVATAIQLRFSGAENTNVQVVAQVAKQAERFKERIDEAMRDAIRYPEDWGAATAADSSLQIYVDLHDTICTAMFRLDQAERQSMVYWVLQEVAARDMLQEIATQSACGFGTPSP